MKRQARSAGIFVLLTAMLMSASYPAMAIDDIVIPIDTVVRSDEGVLTQLASVAVDPELVGAACVVSAEADNNESVHPNNDILVSSGSDQVELLDVEGADSLVTIASGTLTLGETVLLTLRMGSDRVFSGGITVTIDCEVVPEPTTPTTIPEPTTTTTVPEPTTTTTVPEPTTTTTVPEPTTTTTVPEPTTTTTVPEPTTTTTVPETTTTTAPDATSTSTTLATTTTTSPTQVRGVQINQTVDQTDSLPFTGSEPETRFALAFYLITTGILLYRLAADEIEVRSRT